MRGYAPKEFATAMGAQERLANIAVENHQYFKYWNQWTRDYFIGLKERWYYNFYEF